MAAEKKIIFARVDVEYTLEDGRINEEVEVFFLAHFLNWSTIGIAIVVLQPS